MRRDAIVFDRTMTWVTVRLYEIGETLTTIAERVGVSEPLIQRKLVEAGCRPRWRVQRAKCRPRFGLAWIQQAAEGDPLDFVAVDDAP